MEGVVTASKMLVIPVRNRIEVVKIAKVRRAEQAHAHALALGDAKFPIAIVDYPCLAAHKAVRESQPLTLTGERNGCPGRLGRPVAA